MLGAGQHRWYVSIESVPGITVARYGHESRALGHQIWDELVWPLSTDSLTEAGVLAEIYTATLDFWSVRR